MSSSSEPPMEIDPMFKEILSQEARKLLDFLGIPPTAAYPCHKGCTHNVQLYTEAVMMLAAARMAAFQSDYYSFQTHVYANEPEPPTHGGTEY